MMKRLRFWLRVRHCRRYGCVEYGNLTGLPQAVCCCCGAKTRHYDFERMGGKPSEIGVPCLERVEL